MPEGGKPSAPVVARGCGQVESHLLRSQGVRPWRWLWIYRERGGSTRTKRKSNPAEQREHATETSREGKSRLRNRLPLPVENLILFC